MKANQPVSTRAVPAFVHSGFAVLRTPLCPIDGFISWAEPQAENNGVDPNGGGVKTSDAAAGLHRLRHLVDNPAFKEAVRIASPDLHRVFSAWLAGEPVKDPERLEQSLVRYFSRASYRTTPFGLFAGCSLVAMGSETRLDLCGRSEYTRHSRLDMGYVAQLAILASGDPEVRRAVTLRTNASAAALGGRLHYVETRYYGDSRRYVLTAADPTEEISSVLARASDGARFDELVDVITASGFELVEAEQFVMELLDAQLLVADIEPTLIAQEASQRLVQDLELANHAPATSNALRTVIARLAEIDAIPVGCSPQSYEDAFTPLQATAVRPHPNKVLQVDMYKPSAGLTVGPAVIADLVDGVALLARMSPRSEPLAAFIEEFEKKYETREVPLLEALDEEVGVGFPTVNSSDALSRRFGDRLRMREAWLAELRCRATQTGGKPIELTSIDVQRLSWPDPAPVGDAVAVLATIVAGSARDINSGNYQILMHNVTGPSGARLLGRFAHLHPDFERSVRSHVEAEQALWPNIVFAEIVHLPQGRIGNIAARPSLRRHEIPYLGRGNASHADQIQVADLTVSLQHGRVLLRSLRLDCEVRPRLSCAHNFAASRELPVYRFLASLQDHGVAGAFSWSWGSHAGASSLPRITHGRLVLCRALWNLNADDIKELARSVISETASALDDWRRQRGMPRYVVVSDGDNRLPIDLANRASGRAFVRLIHARQGALVEEMFPEPGVQCVSGPEGRFTHELLVPLVRRPPTEATTALSTGDQRIATTELRRAARLGTRRYPPASEWLYVKLFCGTGSADLVLREIVAPLIDRARSEDLFSRWFFVRYTDDGFHLRLRFRSQPSSMQKLMQVVGTSCAPAVTNGRVSRLVFDTYMPEVERYGGIAGVDCAETIFHSDSEAALAFVVQRGVYSTDHGPSHEMIILAGIHRIFNDAGLSADQQIGVLEAAVGIPTADIRRERSARFRGQRTAIAAALAAARRPSGSLVASTLEDRSRGTIPAIAHLRQLEAEGKLMGVVDQMLFSFTHMWTNRMVSRGTTIEPTLYDMLLRELRGERARHSAPSLLTSAVALDEG